jgi:glutaredoxin
MPSEMSALPLPEISLYTRPGCDLCDGARATLQEILEDRAARGSAIATVNEIDITSDTELENRYFDVIPVIEMGGRRLDLAISPAKLRRFVADGLDAAAHGIA